MKNKASFTQQLTGQCYLYVTLKSRDTTSLTYSSNSTCLSVITWRISLAETKNIWRFRAHYVYKNKCNEFQSDFFYTFVFRQLYTLAFVCFISIITLYGTICFHLSVIDFAEVFFLLIFVINRILYFVGTGKLTLTLSTFYDLVFCCPSFQHSLHSILFTYTHCVTDSLREDSIYLHCL